MLMYINRRRLAKSVTKCKQYLMIISAIIRPKQSPHRPQSFNYGTRRKRPNENAKNIPTSRKNWLRAYTNFFQRTILKIQSIVVYQTCKNVTEILFARRLGISTYLPT